METKNTVLTEVENIQWHQRLGGMTMGIEVGPKIEQYNWTGENIFLFYSIVV